MIRGKFELREAVTNDGERVRRREASLVMENKTLGRGIISDGKQAI